LAIRMLDLQEKVTLEEQQRLAGSEV
jgi:hypothetical protein